MLFVIADFILVKIANTIVWILSILPRRNKYCEQARQGIKHILIVANNPLGDTIVRMPFYVALREMFPAQKYHIAIVLTKPMTDICKSISIFDEIIESEFLHNNHPIFWIFGKKQFLANILRWAFFHKIDIFIPLLRARSLGCDYIFRLTRPNVSISYTFKETGLLFPMAARYQKDHCDKDYTHLLEARKGVHQLDDLSKILRLLKGRSMSLPLTRTASMLVSIFRNHIDESLPKKYIVLVPGAGAVDRRWPISRFAEVANRLGGDFVIVGNSSEIGLGEEISAAMSKDVGIRNLCGRTSLLELGGILANASLVLTNETGTATFSTILQTPTLCLLGGGDFGAFFPNPYYPNAHSIYHKRDCFLCGWNCPFSTSRNLTAPCIEAISVDEVVAEAQAILADN